MKVRIQKKIFKNMYELNYNINQILSATRGLFLTPIRMKNGYRYYASYYFGKITKYKD